MRAIVERWRRSGLRSAEFCRRRGVDPQRLSYWKRVLGVLEERPKARRVSFTPVQVVELERSSSAGLEVVLPGGERLVVREGVAPELLQEVLRALRERC
jgi:hypothetical protein